MNYTQAEFDNLRDVNDRLRAENAELKTNADRLAVTHARISLELGNVKQLNNDLTDKLARLEERHHRVCSRFDTEEQLSFKYRTALDILLERLIDFQIQPLVDEIGI
jgi:predicted nuclease with TOPRIM domain